MLGQKYNFIFNTFNTVSCYNDEISIKIVSLLRKKY